MFRRKQICWWQWIMNSLLCCMCYIKCVILNPNIDWTLKKLHLCIQNLNVFSSFFPHLTTEYTDLHCKWVLDNSTLPSVEETVFGFFSARHPHFSVSIRNCKYNLPTQYLTEILTLLLEELGLKVYCPSARLWKTASFLKKVQLPQEAVSGWR